MSKIQQAFQNGKAFIAFVTCGDPDLETTARLIREMAAAGADEACCARLGAAARIRLPKATAAIQRERVMSSFPTAFRQ